MSPQCAGFKRDGTPCTATVEPPQTHCWWHDPANAEQRRRAASKAGRGRQRSTAAAVEAVLREIDRTVGEVRAGELGRGDASVICQLFNAKLRGLETKIRCVEHEEFASRLEELEQHRAEQRWRAS